MRMLWTARNTERYYLKETHIASPKWRQVNFIAHVFFERSSWRAAWQQGIYLENEKKEDSQLDQTDGDKDRDRTGLNYKRSSNVKRGDHQYSRTENDMI
jgi:hypothetical protein